MRLEPFDTVWEAIDAFTGPKDQLDGLIVWLAGRQSNLKKFSTLGAIDGGAHMQRQFTIELRVDFEDPEKLPLLQQVLQQAARHAFATAKLISDNEKTTQIAIFSDDWFSGHEEISLLEDVIAQGKAATSQPALEAVPAAEDDGLSDEMKAFANGN